MKIGVVVLFVLLALSVVWLIWYVANYNKTIEDTQRKIIDADLIKKIHEQPDGLLSPHQLAELTDLSLAEARLRLSALSVEGILTTNMNSKGRNFFALRQPYVEPRVLHLSTDPFLTVEDLLQVFVVSEGKIDAQDLVLATRLPMKVIKREMKHFEKEGVVQQLYSHETTMGAVPRTFYVLQEPYRSNPGAFRERAEEMDLKLKELLTNENLIV